MFATAPSVALPMFTTLSAAATPMSTAAMFTAATMAATTMLATTSAATSASDGSRSVMGTRYSL